MASLPPLCPHRPLLCLLLATLVTTTTTTTLCTRAIAASHRRRLGLFNGPSSSSPSLPNTFDSPSSMTTPQLDPHSLPLARPNLNAYHTNPIPHANNLPLHPPYPNAYPDHNLPFTPTHTNPNAYPTHNLPFNPTHTNPNAYPTHNLPFDPAHTNLNNDNNNYYATSFDYSTIGTTYPSLSNAPPSYGAADAPPTYRDQFPSSQASPSTLANPSNPFGSFYSPSSTTPADGTRTFFAGGGMSTSFQNESPYTTSFPQDLSQSKPFDKAQTLRRTPFYGSFPFSGDGATYGQVNVP